MPVQMKLSRIITSDISPEQIIYLKEVEGERTFPIIIGIFEANSIERRVRKNPVQPARPLTHDLMIKIVQELGGELDSVVISELRDRTYYAQLRIKREGEMIEVDSRPSDAIAIAVTCEPPLPIYVSEEVLDETGKQ